MVDNKVDPTRKASTTFSGVVNAPYSVSALQLESDERQDEPNAPDDNDARKADGNDGRLGPYSHNGA